MVADPPRLPLPDHVHRLVSVNRSLSCSEFAKALLGLHPSFDRSMILLQDVVQILDRSMSAPAVQGSLLFHAGDRRLAHSLTGALPSPEYEARRHVGTCHTPDKRHRSRKDPSLSVHAPLLLFNCARNDPRPGPIFSSAFRSRGLIHAAPGTIARSRRHK
jgi:hypothetical protein